MGKNRLDVMVSERGLAESREQAQRLIRAGQVRVNGHVLAKPGQQVSEDVSIDVTALPKYVSRGGEKMEAALAHFELELEGQVCVDIGSSTGGFTDCMLQHGAKKVYAVDVGKGQLHWKLRTNERVVVMEEMNARYLDPAAIPEQAGVGTVDVSFISLTKVLGPLIEVLQGGADIITLIKPQFEAGREQVQKGGVVRDARVHEQVCDAVREFGTGKLGLTWMDCMRSPLTGPAGNVEFLAHWRLESS